ncbi:MAG: 3-hydroxyacyl-ACP dehydratase FabZ [Victivallales bacterium]
MSEQILCPEKIKEFLPYRHPLLFVDRVFIESEKKYIGLKNLSMNEAVFQGHFPGHPILPGILHVEAMEQVAEIAVRKVFNPKSDEEIYIKGMKKVKFRKPAVPGDRLRIEIEIKNINGNEADISAANYTNSGLACQANLILSVRSKKIDDSMPKLFTKYDKNAEIAMDSGKIMSIIPHRYPFLLVDYIVSVTGAHVIAIKNVTGTEPFFHGYSPDYSVLPGAVHAEIIAQSGCVMVLARPENRGKIAYFMAIDNAEYFHPVTPGDQLRIEVDVPEGSSRFGRGEGFIYVEDKIVSKSEITFAVIDNK